MNIQKLQSELSLEEKVRLCMDGSNTMGTAPIPEHGIPKLVMTDGTNGVRIILKPDPDPKEMKLMDGINANFDSPEALEITASATCFPAGSSLACSWDPELAEEVGAAVAAECKRLGAGLLLGPGLNTRRSPLDGRGFEYYSEDPVLAGDMTTGYVKGVQGNGVGACVKHFACNNSDYMRTKYDNIIEERALREIYLAAFERVVKQGKPVSVMPSYNLINGVHSCESEWLLTDVLRKDWEYEGLTISDCGAVKDHVKAFKAGLDFEMPISKIGMDKLIQAVENGELKEEEIDLHNRRVLDVVFKYTRHGKQAPDVDFDAHHQLARKAALESAVLLKNEQQILPLSKESKIAVIGKWAKQPLYGGTGCAIVNAQQVDIPLTQIMKYHAGEVLYADGYHDLKSAEEELIKEAEEKAAQADCVIIFAGATLPPETDEFNRKSMDIEPAQEVLIRRIAKVNPNVIVVLANCESVVMPWIDEVKAVLDCWYCGEGFGDAVAQLLFGESNPCGKLPVTMPKRLEDCPDYLHFPGENHHHLYGEGIYVGYRYYDKKKIEPLFPFGHGLSYTTFTYSDLEIPEKECTLPDEIEVACTITNSGKVSGSEIVQLYISDDHSRLHRPVKELKGFKKVFLKPGESKRIVFKLGKRDFAYYDPAFSDWVVDTGIFEVAVGASSADIRLSGNLHVISDKKYYLPITSDSHYIEIFQNEYAKQVFFDTIVEWGLLREEELTDEIKHRFYCSFWGMAEHFNLLVPYQVTEEMIEDLVERMNDRPDCKEG